MITLYKHSIPNDDGYSNLVSDSDSTDHVCANCTMTKEQKAKRGNVELYSYQTRLITDYESGETICSNCGLVISDRTRPNNLEWHNSEQIGTIYGSMAKDTRQRTGPPSSLANYDKGLYTIIGKTDYDVNGRQLDPIVRYSMHKIRIHDVRTQSSFRDRNRKKAFTELDKLKNKMGLSDAIIEKTAYLYRKAEKRGMIRGRTITSVLAASLNIACREVEVPKTLKEIAKASNIRLKTLSKDYRLLLTELNLKVPNNDLMHCIFKVGNALQMTEKTKRKAIELADLINKKDEHTYTSGKDPMGLAATTLFIASTNNGENVTQREIADAAGLTAVTIRCRLKEIGKYLESFSN